MLIQKIKFCIFIFTLIFSSFSHGATEKKEIKLDVKENGTGVIHTGNGNINITLSLKDYEDALKRRKVEITESLEKSHLKEKSLLEQQLQEVKKHLENSSDSYKNHIEDLRNRIAQLESIRGQISNKLLNDAQQALSSGEVEKADNLFEQIAEETLPIVNIAAEAIYQRCKIALDRIKYRKAFSYCDRAVQLNQNNINYINSIANLSYILGKYTLSKYYAEQAIEIQNKKYKEGHYILSSYYNMLGMAWQGIGNYKESIKYYEKALSSALNNPKNDEYKIALYRNNLSFVLMKLGDRNKVVRLLEKGGDSTTRNVSTFHGKFAINIGSSKPKNQNIDVISEQGVLQRISSRNMDSQISKPILINIEKLRKNNKETRGITFNIPLEWQIILKEKRNSATLPALQKRLHEDLKKLGENHPIIATDYNNLGVLYNDLKKYKEALFHYEKSLSINIKLFGETHPEVALNYNNLAAVWNILGKHKKALGFYEKALEIDLKNFNEDHPTIATRLNNLGTALHAIGSREEALRSYERALKISEEKLGKNNPSTKIIQKNIKSIKLFKTPENL